MTASQLIHADGIAWPIETYLDAYAYRRVDPFARPSFDGQVRVLTVTEAGELRAPTYADQVIWHDVIAFRPADSDVRCRICGDLILRLADDICGSCDDDFYSGWG